VGGALGLCSESKPDVSRGNGLQDDDDKDGGGQGEVQAVSDGESEDPGEILTIQSHDGSIVEGNGQDREGREVELVGKGKDGETDDGTDGDSIGVDRVVPHMLENDTGVTDGVDDSRETVLGQDDISGTANSVGGTLNGNTGAWHGTRRGSLALSPVVVQG